MLYKTKKYTISIPQVVCSFMAIILMLMNAQMVESRLVWIPRMESMNDDSTEAHDTSISKNDKMVINN